MVRTYQRKSNRQSWSAATITMAVNEVVLEKNGISKGSKKNMVCPQTTLERRVLKYRVDPGGADVKKIIGNFKPVFAQEMNSFLTLKTWRAISLVVHPKNLGSQPSR